jgi:hypothetical protein
MQSYGIDTKYINKHMHIQVMPNRYEHIQNIQISKYTYRSFIEYINLNIVLHIFSKKNVKICLCSSIPRCMSPRGSRLRV